MAAVDETNTAKSCSIRRRFLSAAAPRLAELGLRTPARFEIEWSAIAPIADGDEKAAIRVLEMAADAGLSESKLFVQACPHDEGIRRDLSFAGVFKTYHPRRGLSQASNIAQGIRYVLTGRRSMYADTYYARHGVGGPRAVDAKLSSFIDGILIIGTGYVHGERCLLQYFDSYLSLYVNDPRRLLATRCDYAWDSGADLDHRLVRGCFGLADYLTTALDIEFVVTAAGDIVMTQLRPIPPAHRRAWDAVSDATWARLQRVGLSSVVPDSAGRYEGEVVDLRSRDPMPGDARRSDPIFVVRHQAGGGGVGTLPFLAWAHREGVNSFGLLVDHGVARRNDHLDYILLEDPHIAFVAGATHLPAKFDSPRLQVDSDGFALTLTTG